MTRGWVYAVLGAANPAYTSLGWLARYFNNRGVTGIAILGREGAGAQAHYTYQHLGREYSALYGYSPYGDLLWPDPT